ncbi:MAG: hypothetical protein GY776_07050 [Alteromonas sp.]|nr:hypothetical protein [Alteromonas sp.]
MNKLTYQALILEHDLSPETVYYASYFSDGHDLYIAYYNGIHDMFFVLDTRTNKVSRFKTNTNVSDEFKEDTDSLDYEVLTDFNHVLYEKVHGQ